MNYRILDKYDDVEKYLYEIQQNIDQNKNIFGFVPVGLYQQSALQNNIWVAVSKETSKYIGHIMFSGASSKLSIWQLFVLPECRKFGIACKLTSKLVEFAENQLYYSIKSRVAADLEANAFWERAGFELKNQEPGGRTTGRIINIRVKELNVVPTLFKEKKGENDLFITNSPILSVPEYVIDINVLLDLTNGRLNSENVSILFCAGHTDRLNIRVTDEFAQELERHTAKYEDDPILRIAKTIPVLSMHNNSRIEEIISELKPIIFPGKNAANRFDQNSLSDLRHVAISIINKTTGFITSDGKVLKASSKLKEKYNLEIISPADFMEIFSCDKIDGTTIIQDSTCLLNFTKNENCNLVAVEDFLKKFGIENREDLRQILNSGTKEVPRRFLCANEDEGVVGFTSWDAPIQLIKSIRLYLYVDEENKNAQRIIDHMLETFSRDIINNTIHRIDLHIHSGDDLTKNTALKRGFLKLHRDEESSHRIILSKIYFGGVLYEKNWAEFIREYKDLSGFSLSPAIPAYKDFVNTGISIKIENFNDSYQNYIKLFEFETYVSPGIVLCKGRDSIIVPIRKDYSEDLLGNYSEQLPLFNSLQAQLHLEKAYFKSPRNALNFKKGTSIFFYESGHNNGSMEIIGCARITYSDIIHINEVEGKFNRQGVLPTEKLKEICDGNDMLHVFTFDNFTIAPNKVDIRFLKKEKFVSGANLITAERIDPVKTRKLFEVLFNLK